MKKLFFNQHLDLNACTTGQLFKIFLIRQLSHLISRKKPENQNMAPAWSDFPRIWLVQRCFFLFQAIDRLRWMLARLISRS